ncbi:MAG: tetratricopeptide repeat protein [Candidatus Atabeyarchaeum deiterrae]
MAAKDWYTRGVEHGIKGNIDEEIKCYLKALEIDPKFAKAWKNLGSAFMVKGDLNRGLRALKVAVRLDPNDLNLWMDMGRLKFNSRDYRGAIDSFKKVIEVHPRLAKAWHWLGLSFHELNLEEEAKEALTLAAELYKKSGDIESATEVESKLLTSEGRTSS